MRAIRLKTEHLTAPMYLRGKRLFQQNRRAVFWNRRDRLLPPQYDRNRRNSALRLRRNKGIVGKTVVEQRLGRFKPVN